MQERVKTLTGSDNVKLIEFFLEEFQSKIKSICGRNDFPIELEYLAVKYAANNIIANKNGYGSGKKEVGSLSDNGQNIVYTNTTALKKEDIDLDLFINKSANEISKYAFMGW